MVRFVNEYSLGIKGKNAYPTLEWLCLTEESDWLSSLYFDNNKRSEMILSYYFLKNLQF